MTYSTGEIPNHSLSFPENLPAFAKKESSYWKGIVTFPGVVKFLPEKFVQELLDDEKISYPCPQQIDDDEGNPRNISDQFIKDQRRCYTFSVVAKNGFSLKNQTIYSSRNTNNPFEVLISGRSDVGKSVATFFKFVRAIGGNYNLAEQIAKICTQAVFVDVAKMVMSRFSNYDLPDKKHTHCGNLRIKVDVLEKKVVSIICDSIWSVSSLEEPLVNLNYLLGRVKVVTWRDQLEEGIAKEAVTMVTCSPFYKTEEEALLGGGWPSEADTKELFDKSLLFMPFYKEKLHTFYFQELTLPFSYQIEEGYFHLKNALKITNPIFENYLIAGETFKGASLASSSAVELIKVAGLLDINVESALQLLVFSLESCGRFLSKSRSSYFTNPGFDRAAICDDFLLEIDQREGLCVVNVGASFSVHDIVEEFVVEQLVENLEVLVEYQDSPLQIKEAYLSYKKKK